VRLIFEDRVWPIERGIASTPAASIVSAAAPPLTRPAASGYLRMRADPERHGLPQQFTLNFDPRQHLERDHFERGEANRAAIALADTWPAEHAPVTLLIGPEASGKSHLAAIIADEQAASLYDAASVDWHALAAKLAEDGWDRRLIIEDAGTGIDEAGLFHLVNAVSSSGAWLLLTARTPPSEWRLKLPDLISRLRAATPVTIEAPEDDLLEDIIAKHLADRQTVVDPAVIRYCVARLDGAALARKSAITRALAGEILSAMHEPDLPGLGDDEPAAVAEPANNSAVEKPS
jgi:chromosomal replication initiation ATPase DnaA